MSKMAFFRGIGLTFMMLMMIGVANGRWLELEPYLVSTSSSSSSSSSSSLISDGIDDMSYENRDSDLCDQERCKSIYGFLPCADTFQEEVALMIIYMFLLVLGEEWMREGSEDLFLSFGDKTFSASVFRVLMALPRIAIVIASSYQSTTSAAQKQVAFGVSMYAGTTIITLTLVWAYNVILCRDELRGKESTSTTPLSFTYKLLTYFTDNGANIDEKTGNMGVIMLLSLIPFAIVELGTLIGSPVMIFFALVASVVLSVLYVFVYLWIRNPWIRFRSLGNLKQEILRSRFLSYIGFLSDYDLTDEKGNLTFQATRRVTDIFSKAKKDNDGSMSEDALEHLIEKTFKLDDEISKEYVKTDILTHFNKNEKGKYGWFEFKKGFLMWLESAAHISGSLSKIFLEQISRREIDAPPVNMPKPISKASIMYFILGIGVIYLISGAFMQNVIQFSNTSQVPFNLTSFFVAPFAMNSMLLIKQLLSTRSHHVSKNASFAFFEIYSGLVMNNLLGLTTLLVIVHIKGLAWTYSNEVLTIMLSSALVGLFAFKRETYALWTSIIAVVIYPIYVYVFYHF